MKQISQREDQKSKDTIILRGSICTRKTIPGNVLFSLYGKPIEIVGIYWKPIVQELDWIEEGIKLMQNGLQ